MFAAHLVCPAGAFETTAPTATSDRACSPCSAGYYCAGDLAQPQPCGSAAKWSAESYGACKPALPGTYTLPEAGDATIRTGVRDCPAGYSCNDGIRTRCITGTYQSLTGKAECLPCFTCPNGVNQVSSCTSTQNTRCLGMLQ